jgi:hypothetical protein
MMFASIYWKSSGGGCGTAPAVDAATTVSMALLEAQRGGEPHERAGRVDGVSFTVRAVGPCRPLDAEGAAAIRRPEEHPGGRDAVWAGFCRSFAEAHSSDCSFHFPF